MSLPSTLWAAGIEVRSDATGAVYQLVKASTVVGFWVALVRQPGDTQASVGATVALDVHAGPYSLDESRGAR